MERNQISQLIVFVTVARTGNFRAAAIQLEIAPSAVSHAISSLENSMGIRLLARTTRSMQLTVEGARLLERVSGPLFELEAGFREVTEDALAPSGPLRVTMPYLAANEIIMKRLQNFASLYPAIELDIRVTDILEDIVERGCDAGIRLGESLDANMIAIRASSAHRSIVIGAPAYFEMHKKPIHPRDLAEHNCIRRRFETGRIYRWELEKDGYSMNIEVKGNLILPQQELIRKAALDGIGLAFIFEETVKDDLMEGSLISVMDEWCPSFDGFYIYYPSRNQMRPALRAFIDFFKY